MIRRLGVGDSPHVAEEIVNSVIPSRNYRRLPKMSLSLPPVIKKLRRPASNLREQFEICGTSFYRRLDFGQRHIDDECVQNRHERADKRYREGKPAPMTARSLRLA
jgi:hypothetical protein